MTAPADTPDPAVELTEIIAALNGRPEPADLQDVRNAIALAQRGHEILATLTPPEATS